MLNRLHNCFSRVLSDSLACLTMWSMIETHVLLQSSGLNFGTPLDLVQSLVVLTIPKLMVRRRGNTERWNRPLDVCWLSNLYLKQSGVSYYHHVEFTINSTVAESIGHSPFELVYGEQVRLPVDAIVGNQSGMSAANFVQHI